MLAKGCINPSASQYGSLVLLVQKKTGKLWMCIEFFALCANIKWYTFPFPHITDFLDKLGKVKCSSSIDLATASYQVRIAQENTQKTALFNNKGLYEYVLGLNRLYNIPLTFQRPINLMFFVLLMIVLWYD